MAFLHTLKDFSGSVMDSELTVRIGTRIRSSIKLKGTMNITFVLLIIL